MEVADFSRHWMPSHRFWSSVLSRLTYAASGVGTFRYSLNTSTQLLRFLARAASPLGSCGGGAGVLVERGGVVAVEAGGGGEVVEAVAGAAAAAGELAVAVMRRFEPRREWRARAGRRPPRTRCRRAPRSALARSTWAPASSGLRAR